jgi:hypothetical protein
MLDPQGRELGDELLGLIRAGGDPLRDDHAFTALALRLFAYTFHRIPAYAAYSRARSAEPGTVDHWTDIPAVPTAALKELVLLAEGATAERVFRTSGTTRGVERRGEHHLPDPALYHASLRAGFVEFLLPDGARLPCLSLIQPLEEAPDSSLSFMADDVLRTFGSEGSGTFAGTGGIDLDGLDAAARELVAAGRPVLLLGTTAAFVHWLDRLAERGERYALPIGSRLMDTGGFKGGGRQVDPEELRSAYADRLALPPEWCVNEYGMTEMLSQYYDLALRDHVEGRSRPEPRRKGSPPWVRTVAVDPETLAPLPPGSSGILRHLDLANVGTAFAIQTEDFGRVDEHGLVLEGRALGAPPRGCSIAMDLILRGP